MTELEYAENSITQGRSNKITYVSDFDQLTWIIDMDRYKFYECDVPWQQRSRFRHWIEDNIEGEILIWNGLLSPDPGIQGGWANMVSPDPSICFLIFMTYEDEVKFNLSLVGAADSLCKTVHASGTTAYHSRKRK